jgi:N-acetylmuramoyl-L-alanine amidase
LRLRLLSNVYRRPWRPAPAWTALGLSLAVAVLSAQTRTDSYTVYTAEGRRTLPFRSGHDTDMVPVDQVARLFGMTVSEDSLAGGFVLKGRGQTILLIAGQSLASVGPGKIITLPAPLERQRNVWQVPIEFTRAVLGPSLNLRVELRRSPRVLLVGDVRLPQVAGRFERQGPNGRLVLDIQPGAPRRVTRTGNRLTVRFDAVALDVAQISGLLKDFATAIRVDGTALHIDLGPATDTYRAVDLDATHLAIDFLVTPPPPPVTQTAAATPATQEPAAATTPTRPAIDTTPGRLRTVVVDPGHGGDDLGVTGPGGTTEKALVLEFARRLKTAIEGRIGVRVLLTRDTDTMVPVDKRASIANNNKADLFISLHANSSRNTAASGAQVLSVRIDDYGWRKTAAATGDVPVAFVGGGTRIIDVLPWDMAQVGFTKPSAVVAGLLHEHLVARQVPVFGRPTVELPLRPLVGASMPAILLELGFLSNPADEQALKTPARLQQLVEAMLALLTDIKDGVPSDTPPAR